jgi:hypothetical protein
VFGDKAALRERGGESGLAFYEAHVRKACDDETQTGAGAVDGGNQRLAQGHEVGERHLEVLTQFGVARIGVVRGQILAGGRACGHRVQTVHIHPGAEPATGTGKYDADDRRIAFRSGEGMADLGQHARGEGVQCIRPVHGDDGDRVANVVDDFLIHGWASG